MTKNNKKINSSAKNTEIEKDNEQFEETKSMFLRMYQPNYYPKYSELDSRYRQIEKSKSKKDDENER